MLEQRRQRRRRRIPTPVPPPRRLPCLYAQLIEKHEKYPSFVPLKRAPAFFRRTMDDVGYPEELERMCDKDMLPVIVFVEDRSRNEAIFNEGMSAFMLILSSLSSWTMGYVGGTMRSLKSSSQLIMDRTLVTAGRMTRRGASLQPAATPRGCLPPAAMP